MSQDPDQRAAAQVEETFLQRWSRRKRAAADVDAAPQMPSAPLASQPQPDAVAPESPPAAEAASELPPVESLTFESDFRAFLQPHVAEDVKRQALRKLLHDPRFNAMDGLDVYIDDYSVASPLEPELARTLAQARYIFDPPPTRVNAAGHVEDVPPEEVEAQADGEAPLLSRVRTDHADTLNVCPRRTNARSARAPRAGGTRDSADGVVENSIENHTTPPSSEGTSPRERRGGADCADGVVGQ
jgi:hypothetical protein